MIRHIESNGYDMASTAEEQAAYYNAISFLLKPEVPGLQFPGVQDKRTEFYERLTAIRVLGYIGAWCDGV